MGRRPITPSIEGINLFRQQRMAPGGRRWSESPIPDPAYRRPRAGGASVTPGSYVGRDTQTVNLGWASVPELVFDAFPLLAGDLLVALVGSGWNGGAWGPVAGFTTLAERDVSAAVGGLAWWSGFRTVAADGETVTIPRPQYDGELSTADNVLFAAWVFRGVSGVVPSVSVSTDVATSIPWEVPGGGTHVWQASMETSSPSHTATHSPATGLAMLASGQLSGRATSPGDGFTSAGSTSFVRNSTGLPYACDAAAFGFSLG